MVRLIAVQPPSAALKAIAFKGRTWCQMNECVRNAWTTMARLIPTNDHPNASGDKHQSTEEPFIQAEEHSGYRPEQDAERPKL